MRVFYIANAYDGAYFVLTNDVEEFFQRMASYVLNLQNSGKLNNYSFGSIEMTEEEYRDAKAQAEGLEGQRIQMKKEQEELENEEAPRKEKRKEGPDLRLV